MFSIGERIKIARKRQGLTQVALAEKANISRSYLGDLEGDRYNPSIETLKSIARALNTDTSEFIDTEEAYIRRENQKVHAREILDDPDATEDEKFEAAIDLFSALYSRSLEASSNHEKHLSINQYIASLMGQKFWKARLGDTLYHRIVKIYGIRHDIPEGKTYYVVDEDTVDDLNQSLNKTAAHLKGGVDISDLPEEDQRDIMDFIAFKREQRKNKV